MATSFSDCTIVPPLGMNSNLPPGAIIAITVLCYETLSNIDLANVSLITYSFRWAESLKTSMDAPASRSTFTVSKCPFTAVNINALSKSFFRAQRGTKVENHKDWSIVTSLHYPEF